MQIKQLSQQYTQNATKGIKESMSTLEEELMKLQDVPIFTKDGNVTENVKKKNNLLAELLGLTTQGAIIRSRYQSVVNGRSFKKCFQSGEKEWPEKNVSMHCDLKTEFY